MPFGANSLNEVEYVMGFFILGSYCLPKMDWARYIGYLESNGPKWTGTIILDILGGKMQCLLVPIRFMRSSKLWAFGWSWAF